MCAAGGQPVTVTVVVPVDLTFTDRFVLGESVTIVVAIGLTVPVPIFFIEPISFALALGVAFTATLGRPAL